MTNFESRESRPPEHYEISMGEQMRIEHPDTIVTGGLTTCHAVGILNTKSRVGYLGHFVSDTNSARDLLDEAIQEAESAADLTVALAGNIPLSREMVAATGDDFDQVLEAFREHGRWLLELVKSKGIDVRRIQNALIDAPTDNDYEAYEMKVDTLKGTITIRKELFS